MDLPEGMDVKMPRSKKSLSLRLDREILEWFQGQGKGYQTRINAVLKAYVKAQKAKGERT